MNGSEPRSINKDTSVSQWNWLHLEELSLHIKARTWLEVAENLLKSSAVTELTQEQNCEIMQLVHKLLSVFGNVQHPHQELSRYPLNARASHSDLQSSRILSPF